MKDKFNAVNNIPSQLPNQSVNRTSYSQQAASFITNRQPAPPVNKANPEAQNKQIKKPSILGPIISFGVTIVLFLTSLEYVEDMWHLYLMFFGWDIVSLTQYFSRKKSYDKLQELSSSPQMNAAVNNSALAYPASITVIRDSSMVGAIVPYKVYLNGNFVGDIKNGKSLQLQTNSSHNIVSMLDNYGNAFKDDAILELSGNSNTEVHVKAGKLLTNLTKVVNG